MVAADAADTTIPERYVFDGCQQLSAGLGESQLSLLRVGRILVAMHGQDRMGKMVGVLVVELQQLWRSMRSDCRMRGTRRGQADASGEEGTREGEGMAAAPAAARVCGEGHALYLVQQGKIVRGARVTDHRVKLHS